jgi:hypothetical protein
MSDWNHVIDLLSFAPGMAMHAFVLFSFLFLSAYLLRTACMTESTQSAPMHMLVCALTLLPAILMAGMLVLGAIRFPERVWINLGITAALYVPWYAGGRITRLARPDTEGADVGWLAMGALITFPAGLVVAVLLG